MTRKRKRPRRSQQEGEAAVDRSACEDSDQLSARSPALSTGYWCAILLFVALLTQWPYFSAGHAWDDIRHLGLIGELNLGQLTWRNHLLRFHNEHFIAAWKVWYYVMWSLAGLSPILWHVTMTLGHGVGGIFLFLILRRYVGYNSVAYTASFLWSVATIGGWDNPLLWIAASHLSFAVTVCLAAMWCVTHVAQRNGSEQTPRDSDLVPNEEPRASAIRLMGGRASSGFAAFIWPVAMGLCLALASSTMGVTLLFAIPIFLQFAWLEKGFSVGGKRWVPWAVCWLLPVLVIGVFQFYIIRQLDLPTNTGSEPASVGLVLQGIVALFGVSLWQLLSGFGWNIDQWGMLPLFVFSVVLVVIGLLHQPLRRITIVIASGCVLYTTLVVIARASMPTSMLVTFGRFLYLPTLTWAIILAAVIERLFGWLQCDAARRRMWMIGGAILFVLLQLRMSTDAAKQFAEINRDVIDVLPTNVALLSDLEQHAKQSGDAMQVTDFAIFIKPLYQPLSVFDAYASAGRGSSSLAIAGTADRDRLRQWLSESDQPAATTWLATLRSVDEHQTVLASLQDRAVIDRAPMAVPDMNVNIAGIEKPIALSKWVAMHPSLRMPNVQIRPAQQIDLAGFQRLYLAIVRIDHPLAARWRQTLEGLFRRAGVPLPIQSNVTTNVGQ